ncbi:hypothetical protein [Dactylosporangium sp. NPDC049140]|jgi:hypothetical protein|uniref:hypothetical protein n=1 Tax=Dactylosporangium sp. NPDC049140 TaxID=3155647 RepID=UPI0033F61DD3
MSSTEALLAIVLLLLILAGVAAAAFGRFRRSSRRRGWRPRGASRTGGIAMHDGSSIDPAAAGTAPPPSQEPPSPPTDVDAAGGPVYATPAGGDVYGTDNTDAQQPAHQPRAASDPQSQYPAAKQPGIWDTTQTEDFRRRWHKVESRFVQDPPGSVTEARQLVDEAVKALAESVHSREEQLQRGSAPASDSIADMRNSVLQYHRLLDRLLSV